jgi:CspA family cold shock protein
MQGTVTQWKGSYGFIAREGGKDVFVHFSDIVSDERYRALAVGDQVEFDLVDAERGPQAVNVTLCEREN